MNNTYPGKFITVEGIEGTGKTTAMRFIQRWLEQHQLSFIQTREPGGTLIAEQIRQLFLKKQAEIMHADTEALLVFAARAQHLQEVIWPALQEGRWVICDRFTDASYAYQGGGRGMAMEQISILENWVQGAFRPDAIILLDAPVEICLQRTTQRGALDRIEVEQNAFFERARAAYLARAAADPTRYKLVDAAKSFDEVEQQIAVIMSQLLVE